METTCSAVPFRDRLSRRASLGGKVALVVEVHPGSYKIGPPSAPQGESNGMGPERGFHEFSAQMNEKNVRGVNSLLDITGLPISSETTCFVDSDLEILPLLRLCPICHIPTCPGSIGQTKQYHTNKQTKSRSQS